jgi:DNA-binding transcriptional ArsR family regulator
MRGESCQWNFSSLTLLAWDAVAYAVLAPSFLSASNTSTDITTWSCGATSAEAVVKNMLDKRSEKPTLPRGLEKKSKYDSFKTRMKILASMIEAGQALTPTQISHATHIIHYPTIRYHVKSLVEEGVVIQLDQGRNEFIVQPFMARRLIDTSLKTVFNTAFNDTWTSDLMVEGENAEMKVKLESFKNSFLYYITYLLETGRFRKGESNGQH